MAVVTWLDRTLDLRDADCGVLLDAACDGHRKVPLCRVNMRHGTLTARYWLHGPIATPSSVIIRHKNDLTKLKGFLLWKATAR